MTMRHFFLFIVLYVFLFHLPCKNEASTQAEQLEEFTCSSVFSDSSYESKSWTHWDSLSSNQTSVLVQDQGLLDKIDALPGQQDVDFAQYSGYVSLDSENEQALFYYLAESPENSSTKPLMLWFNGGPACSSLGYGAFRELGPFRVNSDGETLTRNPYSWINVANVLFVDIPAGVGYSYSKTNETGDIEIADGNLFFLHKWLDRFPKYKGRDLFIAGESYAAHFTLQLAHLLFLEKFGNLRGIIIGNGHLDHTIYKETEYEYLWSHALISDSSYSQIKDNCNFTDLKTDEKCKTILEKLIHVNLENIDRLNIYAPLCRQNHTSTSNYGIDNFDPCSDLYIRTYLNDQRVKIAFHANSSRIWEPCWEDVNWLDSAASTHDLILEVLSSGLPVWLFSGDLDSRISVTATRRSIAQMGLQVAEEWHPWYTDHEVGGFVELYKCGLVLVTIRGAGHMVPSDQPRRALTMITSFLQGKLPPENAN